MLVSDMHIWKRRTSTIHSHALKTNQFAFESDYEIIYSSRLIHKVGHDKQDNM